MQRLAGASIILFVAAGAILMGASAPALPNTEVLAQSVGRAGDYKLPFGANPFAPSNARSASGAFISENEFIPASRCIGCHKSIHDEWNESAHRNSFREPFYQANVKLLIKQRGVEVTRHCESCHNPVALFSGALTPDSKLSRPFDDEGVSCSVCHSIEETTTQGIGSYTLAPPALLVRSNGERVREATDDQIKTDLPSHYRAVMRPLLRTPEFCASCHKAAVVPELNGRKWLRSFAVYDEWQQSAFSTETVQPLSRRERQSCQSCHMPKPAGGKALHRWPGGNTAIPD
ncbi:MAG TPA: multiheme c-type cytochrome, partial [Blastocatellia bacterium]|nr:multiheme c-type cytochrome [Blastocatellia bacterium]